jgi:hypothetical protein
VSYQKSKRIHYCFKIKYESELARGFNTFPVKKNTVLFINQILHYLANIRTLSCNDDSLRMVMMMIIIIIIIITVMNNTAENVVNENVTLEQNPKLFGPKQIKQKGDWRKLCRPNKEHNIICTFL